MNTSKCLGDGDSHNNDLGRSQVTEGFDEINWILYERITVTNTQNFHPKSKFNYQTHLR
jgi:hypothetical protein